MAITFDFEDVTPLKLKKRKTTEWINYVAALHSCTVGTIAYLFCSDAKIIDANRKYLNHNYYTDIITFDYTEAKKISGDIMISLDTVRSNSQQYNTAPMEELYRVIIHGVLHLCGLNDATQEQQETMRSAENEALSLARHKFGILKE